MKQNNSSLTKPYIFLSLLFLGITITCFAQSKISATKSKLCNLKTALVSYKYDLGKFPFAGKHSTKPQAYYIGSKACLGLTDSTNCLITDTVPSFDNLGLKEQIYKKRWKGPYMDSTADDFLYDCWGTPFVLIRYQSNLYLWSAGYDGEFDNFDKVLNKTYKVNDLTCSISRFRKSVGKTPTLALTQSAKRFQTPGQTWTPPTMFDKIISLFKFESTSITD